MNKTLLYIIIAVVVVGGGFMLFGGNNGSGPTGDGGDVISSDDEDFEGSMRALMASGKSVTCTFERSDELGDMSGTVYVDGDRMRGDFVLESPDFGRAETSVINDGTTGYTWGSTPFGEVALKFDVSEEDAEEPEEANFDFDEEMTFRCSGWRVDSSKFTPPGDVNFSDITSQIQQIDQAMEGVDGVQCSACDQIPDAAAKEQCRAALGC